MHIQSWWFISKDKHPTNPKLQAETTIITSFKGIVQQIRDYRNAWAEFMDDRNIDLSIARYPKHASKLSSVCSSIRRLRVGAVVIFGWNRGMAGFF